MNKGVLSINKGKDTLLKCPVAPKYLNDNAKKHYKKMGDYLSTIERLKNIYLPALEVYAESMAMWEFAISEIKRKNIEKYGTGYIQTFLSGAKNISVEVTLKEKAIDDILKCCKIFGLDPKSEKELKSENSGQYSLFEELIKKKNNG